MSPWHVRMASSFALGRAEANYDRVGPTSHGPSFPAALHRCARLCTVLFCSALHLYAPLYTSLHLSAPPACLPWVMEFCHSLTSGSSSSSLSTGLFPSSLFAFSFSFSSFSSSPRVFRDEEKCGAKYGPGWAAYCAKVTQMES